MALHGVQRVITEQAYRAAAVPILDLTIDEAKRVMTTYLEEHGLDGEMQVDITVRVQVEA